MSKASRKSNPDEDIRRWLPSPEQTPEPGDTGFPASTADRERDDDDEGTFREGTVYSPGGAGGAAKSERVGDLSEPVLAEPGRRLVAFLLDAVLFIGTFGIGWLLWSMIEWRSARTPAKRLLRDLAVVDAWSGERAGWRRMAVRELGAKIGLVGLFGMTTFGLGWVIAGALVLSETRAALWDRLAGTTVVQLED